MKNIAFEKSLLYVTGNIMELKMSKPFFVKWAVPSIIILMLLVSVKDVFAQKNKIDNVMELQKNWFIQSSAKVSQGDEQVASSGFETGGWYKATVPSTVMGTLVDDGVFKDIFMGTNLEEVSPDQFKMPWWYRTEFMIPAKENMKTVKLQFAAPIYG